MFLVVVQIMITVLDDFSFGRLFFLFDVRQRVNYVVDVVIFCQLDVHTFADG